MRPTVKLGEIVTILNGRAYSQNELLSKGKYPVLRVGNFFTNSNWYYSDLELEDDKYCNNGDLLYAWSASFGPKIWEGGKTIYHYHIWKIKLSDKIDKHYLYHYLYWDSENIKRNGHGVAMMHVTKGDMERKEIPLPPIETQKAIVAKLDQIFAELDQTKSEIQKNLDNTDELRKSALNQAFQGDWEMKTIEELTTSIEYGIGETGLDKGDLRYVRITDIDEDCLLKDYDKKYIMLNEKSKLSLLKKGDVLIARTGATFGKCLYFDSDEQSAFAGYLIRPNFKNEINTKYFSLFAQSGLYWNQANNLVSGGGQPQFNANAIKKIKFPVPPLSEQEKIVEHLDQVSKEVKALKSQYQSQLYNLEELKKSVLDKAFRGEIG